MPSSGCKKRPPAPPTRRHAPCGERGLPGFAITPVPEIDAITIPRRAFARLNHLAEIQHQKGVVRNNTITVMAQHHHQQDVRRCHAFNRRRKNEVDAMKTTKNRPSSRLSVIRRAAGRRSSPPVIPAGGLPLVGRARPPSSRRAYRAPHRAASSSRMLAGRAIQSRASLSGTTKLRIPPRSGMGLACPSSMYFHAMLIARPLRGHARSPEAMIRRHHYQPGHARPP